ncbi:site-specific DNA-methyltransferase [Enterococcus faecalis]|uniref:site-specific DNA-methyltransferase n=1 Tax=Lactobacillales TaxID=186826 RepID=UPI001EC0365E|nr:site-specific DNA-methyltransferase [Lactococcus garvieae]EHU8535450.1 site-specific DNA-methyltransferase [Enterococcus faecalis]EIZ1162764.1 site-specific DNA-methyltransferase [Enterococcus faecalis]
MQIAKRYELVPLEKIVPYARNSKKHPQEQIAQIRASFREFGVLSPCLVDEEYNLLAGHGRLEAARQEQLTEINCVIVEGLSEAQKKAFIITDNKIGENAPWDTELLSIELTDLQAMDFDLDLLGFDAVDLDKYLNGDEETEDDDFDLDKALEEEPFVKLGDLWHLGNHRLLSGDSTKAEDVDRLMDGKKANLCLTDMPYNVNFDGGKGKIKNDNLSSEEFYEFIFGAFTQIYEHLADGGACYCFHSDSEKVNFYNAAVNSGFHYSTTCIWVKDSLVLGRGDYQQQHEPCLYLFKNTKRHEWFSDRKQTTVWNFDRPKKSEYHSTQKPVPLMAYPIKNSTQANAIVYEPFSGSFSTGIACEQLGRICYAMELDEKFASASIRRYAKDYGAENITVEREGKVYKYSEMVNEVSDDGDD